MKTVELNYNDLNEFVDYIYGIRGNVSISIVGKYDSVQLMVESLIRKGLNLSAVSDFYDPWVSGYNDEYLLSVIGDGTFIEPIRINGEYCEVYDDIVFILGDEVNAKALKHVDGDKIYIVYIDEDYLCDKCDGTCKCAVDVDTYDWNKAIVNGNTNTASVNVSDDILKTLELIRMEFSPKPYLLFH